MLKQVKDEMLEDYNDYKIDIDKNASLAQKHNVRHYK
ncbi:hypothetical protein [uncultured Algibacter sp.]